MVKSIFFKPKYKEASSQISLESPVDARDSIDWLNREWKDASRAKRVRLIRFANLASNRAYAMSKKKNLNSEERVEALDIQNIYGVWVKKHKMGR